MSVVHLFIVYERSSSTNSGSQAEEKQGRCDKHGRGRTENIDLKSSLIVESAISRGGRKSDGLLACFMSEGSTEYLVAGSSCVPLTPLPITAQEGRIRRPRTCRLHLDSLAEPQIENMLIWEVAWRKRLWVVYPAVLEQPEGVLFASLAFRAPLMFHGIRAAKGRRGQTTSPNT
jgi:hypothetical protein